jgi:hypothetical protein
MGHQAIVYGRIQGARNPQGDSTASVHRYNRAVLQGIADLDDSWPFLTRHMFSTAEDRIPQAADRGLYRGQIIHFGASFKDDPKSESHWFDWLGKFEGVLKQLLWVTAKVHIETDFSPEKLYLYRVSRDALAEMQEEVAYAGILMEAQAAWTRETIDLSGIQ